MTDTGSPQIKKKFLRGQKSKIILFKNAAKALKQMGIQKLPDTATLQAEREILVEKKQKEYGEYQKICSQAKEINTIKQNVDKILYSLTRNLQKKENKRE